MTADRTVTDLMLVVWAYVVIERSGILVPRLQSAKSRLAVVRRLNDLTEATLPDAETD